MFELQDLGRERQMLRTHMQLWLLCDKFDDFSEFALMAIEKYDLQVSLTKDQFTSIPREKYKDYFTVPATWNETWNHPCPFQRKLWRDALHKELEKTESNKVYRKFKKNDLPAGRKPIKCKWVCDIKRVDTICAAIS